MKNSAGRRRAELAEPEGASEEVSACRARGKSVEICRAKRINSSLLGSSGRGGAGGRKGEGESGEEWGESDIIVEKMTSERSCEAGGG